MSIASRRLSFVPFVMIAFLAGCASSEADDPATGDDANFTASPASDLPLVASQGGPTIDDWRSHPKIKATLAVLEQIDSLQREDKLEHAPRCDGAIRKFSDDAGRIREVIEQHGDGGVETVIVAYYEVNGHDPLAKLRYMTFYRKNGEHPGTELVVFLDADGSVLFQAIRDLPADSLSSSEGSLPPEADWREPARQELYRAKPAYSDPATWWTSMSCGAP